MSMYEYTTVYNDPINLYGYTRVDGGPKQVVVDKSTVSGTRSGNKVENWRELVRLGRNASSPYNLDRTKLLARQDGTASQVVFQTGYPQYPVRQEFFGVPAYFGKPSHLPGNTAEANSIALSKLYKKLQSERQEWAGASFLAEAVDVLRQFGRPLNGLMTLHSRWRTRVASYEKYLLAVRYDPVKWRRIVADLWLEYSFGLAPLINDTAELATAYARFENEESMQLPLRSAMTSRGETSLSSVEDWAWQGIGNINSRVRPTIITKTDTRVQYTCGLQGDFRAPMGSNARLQELCGFRPADWIPGLYEAIPWSWLLDYVTNVGQILSAAATPTDRVAWVCRTDTQVTTQSVSFAGELLVPAGWDRASYDDASFGSYVIKRTSMTRSIPTTLSIPPFYWKNPLGDLSKMANVAAVFFGGKGDRGHLLGLGPKGLG